MATENQGIMSLPQGEQPQAPELGLNDSYDAVMGGLQDASPQADTDVKALLAQITPMLDQLTDEQLDSFLAMVQYLYDGGEAEYAKRLQEVSSSGLINPGDLPEEYDPELLAAIGTVLLQAQRDRQGAASAEPQMPMPPAGMARGGIANAARMVAAQGRGKDTMLAHVTKKEAEMLRKKGGAGTINPKTGLPEFLRFRDLNPVRAVKSVTKAVTGVVKGVVGAVKSVISSPIGRILATVALATFLGPGAMGITGLGLSTGASMALASGAVTALGGGNIKDVLRSAATAYLAAPGGPVSTYVGNAGAAMGITNAAGQAAINAGLVGTGVGLLTGQKLNDAVKSGLIAGAIQGGVVGATQGFGAQAPVPGQAQAPGQAPAGQGPANTGSQSGLANAPTPPSTDPLGDFIQQNEQLRAQASMPAQPAGSTLPPVAQPEGGIWDTIKSKVLPSEIQASAQPAAQAAGERAMAEMSARLPNATPGMLESAYQNAYKAAMPGVFSTYGPAVGVGLGITGLMGGFTAKQPPPSALENQLRGTPGEDLIKADPKKYLTQNLSGVKYDESGNILGGAPWSPKATMDDVRVPSVSQNRMSPIQPPLYAPAIGSLGQMAQIPQPYNTANMYQNWFMPQQQYAQGGDVMVPEPVHMFSGGFLRKILAELREPFRTKPQPTRPEDTIVTTDPVVQPPVAAPPPVAAQPPVLDPRQRMRNRMSAMFAPPQFLGGLTNLPIRTFEMGGNVSSMGSPDMMVGGLASLAQGGYPRRTGQISGPGTETSDSIPAMLSDGEFVMTAKAVRGAGNGSRRAGAKKMYALMHQLERNASRG